MHTDYVKQLFEVLMKTVMIKSSNVRVCIYEDIINELIECFAEIKISEKQLFFVGNGGSAAIASHMTGDFMKNGGMKTYSLYDNAVTTCMGNDYGYEFVFSKPLSFLANEGDLLVAISSSGNSINIINAINIARRRGAKVVTLTGFKEDNKIKALGDYNIYVPITEYGIVESIHNLILQQIVDYILKRDGVKL